MTIHKTYSYDQLKEKKEERKNKEEENIGLMH